MKVRFLTYHIVGMLLYLTGSLSPIYAQEVNAHIEYNRVKIGEPLKLKLVVIAAKDAKISYLASTSEIVARRLKKQSQITQDKVALELFSQFEDTVIQQGKQQKWIGSYELMAWDTGRLIIPAETIRINDSNYYFNQVQFTVISESLGAKNELFDIIEGQAPISDKPDFLQTLKNNWIIISLCALVLAGIIFLSIRLKNRKPKEKIKQLSLKDRTLFAIDTLNKRRIWEKGKIKTHYSELSHILRAYLSSRYQLNLLERTTFETRTLLKEAGLQAETIDAYLIILRQADMVKFAQSQTDEKTILKATMIAKQIVVETSPLNIDVETKSNQ